MKLRSSIGSGRKKSGSTLAMSMFFSSLLTVTLGSILTLSLSSLRNEAGREQWSQAYYHAENIVNWASQIIADEPSTSTPFLGQYSYSAGTLSIPYLSSVGSTGFKDAWLTIAAHPSGVANLFLVTVSVKVGDKVRTLQADIRKNPPSVIFDYEYFLNNWGWWWGATITGDGGNRANWDFDFRYSPTVNGTVLANGDVASNMQPIDPFVSGAPFGGLAATDLLKYVHSGAPRVTMPNLTDMTRYRTRAAQDNGSIAIGGTQVSGPSHSSATSPGLYLIGTTASPVTINGSVVVDGDVILKGVITGTGTLYVGGNLYLAGNVSYANGPDFSTPPETMASASRDQWVANASSQNKDLIAFAVRGSVFGGNVNDTSDWKYWEYDAGTWGLSNLGSEANLGKDGIRNTPDDGIPYLDTNNDGIPDSAWYDVDGDGVINGNYNYNNDIKMTTTRSSKIDRYPTDSNGDNADYSSLATSSINHIDGIYYCNHAVAVRMGASNCVWNGTVISQDEAIVYNDSLKINYDSRVHSRYSQDPNRVVDFGLPISFQASIQSLRELAPVEGFSNQYVAN